jgi:hypothetical protein
VGSSLWRRRVLLLFVVAAGCVVALVTELAQPAKHQSPARQPTPSERAALQRATNTFESVKVPLASARISTAASTWARVIEEGPASGASDLLIDRRAGKWLVANTVAVGTNPDGGCAYAPPDAMRDLYGVACPPPRALHARHATRAESATLTAAFKRDPKTRTYGHQRGFHLANACISRLNRSWASAIGEFPDTGIGVWFTKTGSTWRVAHFHPAGPEPIRPRPIILSLASCTGYNASDYGA